MHSSHDVTISFAVCCMQPTDVVELCSFELYSQSKWKLMAEDAIRSVCDGGLSQWPVPPPLCANTLDAAAASNDLEHQLRQLVTEHRRVRDPHTLRHR